MSPGEESVDCFGHQPLSFLLCQFLPTYPIKFALRKKSDRIKHSKTLLLSPNFFSQRSLQISLQYITDFLETLKFACILLLLAFYCILFFRSLTQKNYD